MGEDVEGCPRPGGEWKGWRLERQWVRVSPHPPRLPLPHLSAGLGGDLKGGLEGSSLLRGEDGPGSLGPPWVLPIIPAALALAALSLGWLHVPILVLTLYCEGHNPACQPCTLRRSAP